jgi:hypothetical protein
VNLKTPSLGFSAAKLWEPMKITTLKMIIKMGFLINPP